MGSSFNPKPLVAFVPVTEAINNMNSIALVDSTALQLTLGVGQWFIDTLEILGDSSAAAGAQTKLTFTGTWVVTGGCIYVGSVNGVNGSINQPNQFVGVTPGDGVPAIPGIDIDTVYNNANSGLTIIRSGLVNVTVAGILKIQTAQSVATVSNHWLFNGSYLKAAPR